MKHLQDLANLITVRNFLISSIDNLNIKLTREDVKNIQLRASSIDKIIIGEALKLDLLEITKEAPSNTKTIMRREFRVDSTEDTEAVMERVKKQEADANKSSCTTETVK